MSSDGRLAAIAIASTDGDRGLAGLTIKLIEVDADTATETFEIVTELELAKAIDSGINDVKVGEELDEAKAAKISDAAVAALRTKVEARIASAQQALSAHTWEPMSTTEFEEGSNEGKQSVSAGDIALTYARPTLTITKGGKAAKKKFPSWFQKSSEDDCPWDEGISAIHSHDKSKTLVVQVSYRGGHHCGEYPDRYHAFRWK